MSKFVLVNPKNGIEVNPKNGVEVIFIGAFFISLKIIVLKCPKPSQWHSIEHLLFSSRGALSGFPLLKCATEQLLD